MKKAIALITLFLIFLSLIYVPVGLSTISIFSTAVELHQSQID